MKRDTIKTIEKFESSGKITNRYDMKMSDILAIRGCCHNDYELITSSFVFGYAQGYKCCLAKKKK